MNIKKIAVGIGLIIAFYTGTCVFYGAMVLRDVMFIKALLN